MNNSGRLYSAEGFYWSFTSGTKIDNYKRKIQAKYEVI